MYCTAPLSPRKGRLISFHDDDDDDDDPINFWPTPQRAPRWTRAAVLRRTRVNIRQKTDSGAAHRQLKVGRVVIVGGACLAQNETVVVARRAA